MTSTSVYINKTAPVYSPSASDLKADIPYAVQVNGVPVATRATRARYPGGCSPPPQNSDPTGHWEIKLFDCLTAPGHYVMAFFFPCVNVSYSAHRIGWSRILTALVLFLLYTAYVVCAIAAQTVDTDGMHFFAASTDFHKNAWNTAASICALLFVAGVVILRRQVRAFYHIPGSNFHDLCVSFWCSCCVVAQMSAHTQRVKTKSSTATLPAYQEA